MKLANLYDTIGKLSALSAKPDPSELSRRIELGNSIISDLLEEYGRLEAYEDKYSPAFEDETEDAYAVEVLRSIRQMFDGWLSDAQPVYDGVSRLPGGSQHLPRLHDLRKAIGFARVRLVGTPEQEIEGVHQLRRGEGIRYETVEEFRNELRAQRRA